MRRRTLLLSFAALALCHSAAPRPDSEQEVSDLFASLAAALSEGNAGAFLEGFDPAMAGFEKLRDDVTGLVREAELQSSIEFLANDGDDRARTVSVDWILRIDQRQDAGGGTRRRQTVKCRVAKQGKRWRIEALDPREFFAPPRL
ncbi:MAG: hypothetical protein LAP87_19190 [Acidobacteriia bacterium]|nr:hypothetical protein [Terriglobia bacterium]